MFSKNYTFYVIEIVNLWSFFLLVVGIVGNMFSFRIYSRQTMTKSSFTIYFRTMSLADLIITLHIITFILRNMFDIDLHVQSNILCKSVDLVLFVTSPISAYSLVAISIDRFIKIKFSRRFELMYKRSFQIALVVCIVVYNVCFYGGILWSKQLNVNVQYDNETNRSSLAYSCDDLPSMQIFYQMDVLNSTIVPYALMVFFSCATIVVVFNSRRKILTSTTIGVRKSRRDRKFAITSITLNTIFLTLNLPIVLFLTYGNSVEGNLHSMLFEIFNAVYYTNYATNFYVQLAVNSIFRREFLGIFNIHRVVKNTQGPTLGGATTLN